MAGFTDAMAIDGKAVIRKIRNGKSLRKGGAVNLEQCDIKITSTVQGGIVTLEMSSISRERVHDMREMRTSLKGCREHPERLWTGMLQEDNATSVKENQSSQRRLQSCG